MNDFKNYNFLYLNNSFGYFSPSVNSDSIVLIIRSTYSDRIKANDLLIFEIQLLQKSKTNMIKS